MASTTEPGCKQEEEAKFYQGMLTQEFRGVMTKRQSYAVKLAGSNITATLLCAISH